MQKAAQWRPFIPCFYMAQELRVGAPRIELGPHVPKTCILPIYYAPKYRDTIAVVSDKDNNRNGFRSERDVFQHSDTGLFRDHVHIYQHDIELPFDLPSSFRQVHQDHAAEFGHLPKMHIFYGPHAGVSYAGLNLDKMQLLSFLYNDINLAARPGIVAFYDLISPSLQIPGSDIFP